MTRINCLPPHALLDEWVAAHCKEGLRPINNTFKALSSGRNPIKNCPSDWTLGEGHEIFCRKHTRFTLSQWLSAKAEWDARGGNGFDFTPADITTLPETVLNDYTPTRKAMRSNLARLCSRWRNREKTLHFKGKAIDNVRDFRQYVSHVKCVSGIY